MKNRKLLLTTLVLLFTGISSFAQTVLDDFVMDWEFTDATGENLIYNQEVCQCGTFYVRNKSKYNNGVPIGTLLTTGKYRVYDYTIPDWQGHITYIEAEDWMDDGTIYPITLPCDKDITRIRILHTGPGTSPLYGEPSSTEHYTRAIHVNKVEVEAEEDFDICPSEGFTLEATGTGTSYSWSPAGGSNNPTLPIFTGSTTTYTVTASKNFSTSSQGTLTCTATDKVKVTVKPAPSLHLTNHALCDGDPLPVLDAGSAPVSYQWKFTPEDDPTSNTTIGYTQTVNTADHGLGQYTALVYGENGCQTFGTSIVEMSSSAGSEMDPEFSYSTSNSLTTTTISASSAEAGNHHWALYESDVDGNLISFVEEIYSITGSHTFSAQPLNRFYKVVHRIMKSPCMQWATAERHMYSSHSVVGVYPNPVEINKPFNIKLMEQQAPAGVIQIRDIRTGQLVYKELINQNSSLSTSLKGGTYNVQYSVYTSSGNDFVIENKRLIVK